jgi:hypothetical protein
MIGISLTVIVCAVAVVAAAGGQNNARSCEVYNETRPITDLEPCRYRFLRDQLGREALARAGRQLQPQESVDTTCRMTTGGSGVPTG